MTTRQADFYTIGEREPLNGEQILGKVKTYEVKDGWRWQVLKYNTEHEHGAIFVADSSYLGVDDIIEYAVLFDT